MFYMTKEQKNKLNNGKQEIVNSFVWNHLVQWIMDKKGKDELSKMDGLTFLRFYRTGIIGQELYDLSFEVPEKLDGTERERASAICELFIFYMRANYDYLSNILRRNLSKVSLPKNFSDFFIKFEGYNISEGLKGALRRGKVKFSDLRDLRNSIKDKPGIIGLYLKDKKIYVTADIYNSSGVHIRKIDEELGGCMVDASFTVW